MQQIRPLKPKTRKSIGEPEYSNRLKAFGNGYWITPAGPGKGLLIPAWNTDKATVEKLEKWATEYHYLQGSSIVVDGDLIVFDIDVAIADVYNKLHGKLRRRWGKLFEAALERTSGGVKRAFFLRTSTPFKYARTFKYTSADPDLIAKLADPATTPEERKAVKAEIDNHCVEVHGGKSTRQMRVSGKHTSGKDYEFIPPERAPWTVKREDLPIFPAEDVGEFLRICEETLAESLTRVPDSELKQHGEVFDLDDDTELIDKAGEVHTVLELEQSLEQGAEAGLRCCLGWNAWSFSTSKANCNAYVGPDGTLIVHDFTDDVIHRRVEKAPIPGADVEELARLMAEHGMEQPEPPPAEEPTGATRSMLISDIVVETGSLDSDIRTCQNAFVWMLANLAHFAKAFTQGAGAVSIHPDGDFPEPISIAALRSRMLPFSYLQPGPNGGAPKRISPLDMWLTSKARIDTYGLRMRPELPRPLFLERGALLLNRYDPPQHPTTGGTIEPFLRFMERLFPDPVERAWVDNWLALKVQEPWRRMVVLVTIATETGTGRGLLFELMGHVLGQRYVMQVPYSKVSGGEGSRFNSEIVGKLLVVINESRAADDRRFSNKKHSMEELKVWAEPNEAIEAYIEQKRMPAFATILAASTMINSNNRDALPLDDSDRRFAIVTCGTQMTEDEVREFRAWMADPVNIGALWRYWTGKAIEQDKTVFNPYMAPRFAARSEMIEAGETEIDQAWELARDALKASAALFTMTQIVQLTKQQLTGGGHGKEDAIMAHTKRHASVFRIGQKGRTLGEGRAEVEAKNWVPTYRGQRERVFAHSRKEQKRFTDGVAHDIGVELDKAQAVVERRASEIGALFAVVGGTDTNTNKEDGTHEAPKK